MRPSNLIMFRPLVPLLTLGLAISSALFATGQHAMKVMSFNVRTSEARDPCPDGCWAQRAPRCNSTLRKHEPDFVGFQELGDDQRQYFDMHLAPLGYTFTTAISGNAMLYQATKWQLRAQGRFWLSDTPDVPSNSWNLAWQREATWARFSLVADRQISVCLVNTHFDFDEVANTKSAQVIAQKMAQLCPSTDTAAVLMGDLNSAPASNPIRYFKQALVWDDELSPLRLTETLEVAGADQKTWMVDFTRDLPGEVKLDFIFARAQEGLCVTGGKVRSSGRLRFGHGKLNDQ